MKNILFILLFIFSLKTFSQQVIWSNDFSNCNSWVIQNAFDEGFVNYIGGINFQCGNQEPSTINSINSTTESNGYMLVDSDAFGVNNTGVWEENCWFQTAQPINISGYDQLSLSFETFYRMWDNGNSDGNEYCLVEVSTDGVNWPDVTSYEVSQAAPGTRFELWPTMETLDPVENSTTKTFNLSQIASQPGVNQIWLRFRWKGYWGYAWMVDDVQIYESPYVDVTFQVDMNNEPVSPDGIHVAGSFTDWNSSSAELFDFDQDGIYSLTLPIPIGQYQYNFINGNNWENSEYIPTSCSVTGYRDLVVGVQPVIIQYCFGSCEATCYASVDYVENFDGFIQGSFLNQTNDWEGWSGSIESTAMVVSQPSQTAPNSLMIDGCGSDIFYQIGPYNYGEYYLAFDILIPEGSPGGSFFLSQNGIGNEFIFNEGVLYSNLGGDFTMISPAIPFNQWINVEIIIDLVNGLVKIYIGNSLASEYGNLALDGFTFSSISLTGNCGSYYIDNFKFSSTVQTCSDLQACNYGDYGDCMYSGANCNDLDPLTGNDIYNTDCSCEGQLICGELVDFNSPPVYEIEIGNAFDASISITTDLCGSYPVGIWSIQFYDISSNSYLPLASLGLDVNGNTGFIINDQSSLICIEFSGTPNQLGYFPIRLLINGFECGIFGNTVLYLNVTTTCTDPSACNYGAPNFCSYLEPQTIIGNANITPFNTYSYVIPQGEYSIEWSAQNGTIITGQGTNAVQIMWLENGPYTASATLIDSLGCEQSSNFIATNNSCNISVSATSSDDVLCPGEEVLLSSATATPNANYQWYLNGQAVPNATANAFDTDIAGEYQVMISIPGCSAISNSVIITVVDIVNEPVIDYLISNPGCGNGVAILSFNDEDFTSFLWSNNQSSPTISVTTSGVYSVSAIDASGCVVTSAEVPINFALTEPNDICLVTVDETTGNNTIVWEPITSEFITDYLIYKETNVANDYALIGSVPYGSDGVFADGNSNAAVQASSYKISVMDICNVESTPSPLQKTIHLTSNLGVGGAINLIWSHYEGAEFGSYNIYRGTTADNLTLLTTVASNLNSYTDLLPITDGYYMIEVEGISCDPSREVMTSKSNIITIAEVGIGTLNTSQFALYPNPANDYIMLSVSERLISEMYVIYDITGREILRGKIHAINTRIALENQSSGSYVLRVVEKGLRFEK